MEDVEELKSDELDENINYALKYDKFHVFLIKLLFLQIKNIILF